MVCTGAKSEEQARKAVQQVVRRLKKGSIPIKNEAEIEIQNIVASANLSGKVHLEEAARQLPKSMYEPEQFPGLIHRMADPKTVILLFASGKLVCTGAKRESEVYRAVNNLHVLLVGERAYGVLNCPQQGQSASYHELLASKERTCLSACDGKAEAVPPHGPVPDPF